MRMESAALTVASNSPGRNSRIETGVVPGFDVSNWIGLFGPAGTPIDIVRRWNVEVNKIMQGADIRQRLLTEGARFEPNKPEEFGAFVQSEIAKWAPVVKASGARVD